MPDSSTGGYLSPTSAAPDDDATLVTDLQAAVVGITGLPGSLVIQMWQPEPPARPPIGTNWAALGTTIHKADTFATIVHDGDGNGTDTVTRNEEIDVLTAFYGPNAEGYAGLLRDGLGLPQNRETLWLQGIKLIEVQPLVKTADLINTQWYPRVDLTWRVRRAVNRTYAVLNLESAQVTLQTDDSGLDITITADAGSRLDFSNPDNSALAVVVE